MPDTDSSQVTTPSGLVEHFFRHETGRLHGALLRLLGVHNLSLAEDIAQDAMIKALQAWSMGGVPPNPAAWITRTAMNLAKDHLRHQRMATTKESAIITHIEQTHATPAVGWENTQMIRDDTLRLMFVCSHPAIVADAQVILALKMLCGFSNGEIARAFLSSESAIEKQLTRIKQRIREAGISFDLPEGEDLAPRLHGVLAALYLLFNEGYKASSGDELLREDLCQEAIRLTSLLVSHPTRQTPTAHALLALMLLTAARFPSRLDPHGALLLLDDQDRSQWDEELISRGLSELQNAAQGNELSEYHLQAGIAALHATATDYTSTDWAGIRRHYDQLYALKPSPVIALNRAVVIAHLHGPQAGLDAIDRIPQREKIESQYLLHAVRGELHLRLEQHAEAAKHFRQALSLARVAPERQHLQRMLEQTGSNSA